MKNLRKRLTQVIVGIALSYAAIVVAVAVIGLLKLGFELFGWYFVPQLVAVPAIIWALIELELK